MIPWPLSILTNGATWGRALNAVGRWLFHKGGWLFVALTLSLAAVAYMTHEARTARAERDALSTALLAAQEQQKLLVRYQNAASSAETGASKAKATISNKEAVGLARTQRALDANRDWADQPVPTAVLDSLRQ